MHKIKNQILQSMSSRIFALGAGLVFLTTTLLIYTVHNQTKSRLLKIQEKNAMVLLTAVNSAVENAHEDIIFFKNKLLEQRKQEVKNQVDIAFQILNYYKKQADKGLISTEEAKKIAKQQIREIRYNQGMGYFWIAENRPFGTVIAHPVFPEVEGMEVKDKKFDAKINSQNKNLTAYFHEITKKNR